MYMDMDMDWIQNWSTEFLIPKVMAKNSSTKFCFGSKFFQGDFEGLWEKLKGPFFLKKFLERLWDYSVSLSY